MLVMDYIYADKLFPDQLMEGDLIEFVDGDDFEIAKVIKIQEFKIENGYSYLITGRNDFNEELEMIVPDNNFVKLFVMK